MRHLLHHPHFPDLIAALAAEDSHRRAPRCANDNSQRADRDDPLVTAIARLEVAATRLW
jgi:hypothetical protein